MRGQDDRTKVDNACASVSSEVRCPEGGFRDPAKQPTHRS